MRTLLIVLLTLTFGVAAEQIWTDFSPKPVGEPDATTGVVVDHLVPIA